MPADNIIEEIVLAGKGDFEDGYVCGFRDSNKLTTSGAARRRLDEDYGGMKMDFQHGYAQGLRDAGWSGMTASMHDLATKKTGSGYSAGYTQGFRDGNSGIFGDRMSTTLLRRLEEQYPTQDDYRQGYIEGFRDGSGSRTDKVCSLPAALRHAARCPHVAAATLVACSFTASSDLLLLLILILLLISGGHEQGRPQLDSDQRSSVHSGARKGWRR